MIEIDERKFHPSLGEIQKVADGSVRILRYTAVEKPEELITMRKGYSWQSEEYVLKVNLPAQRRLITCISVAHTSANAWRISVSSNMSSDVITVRTFNEVIDCLSGL